MSLLLLLIICLDAAHAAVLRANPKIFYQQIPPFTFWFLCQEAAFHWKLFQY